MAPPELLPAVIEPTAVATHADTYADTYIVPALIADLGDQAGWRYVEFFTANIRNPHTRRAYARACARFFAWCEQRGLTLTSIRPHDVATYIEQLQTQASAPFGRSSEGDRPTQSAVSAAEYLINRVRARARGKGNGDGNFGKDSSAMLCGGTALYRQCRIARRH
jgi:hypothetical protein